MTDVAVQVIRDFVVQLRRRWLVRILDRRHRRAVITRLKMASATLLHTLCIRGRQRFGRQDHLALGGFQGRLQTRRRLIGVMTLHTRQHALSVDAVVLQRMSLVVERHLAVFV